MMPPMSVTVALILPKDRRPARRGERRNQDFALPDLADLGGPDDDLRRADRPEASGAGIPWPWPGARRSSSAKPGPGQ